MRTRGIGEDILERMKRPTALVIAAGQAALLVSREVYRLRRGEITSEEFRVRTSGHVGSSAGIVLGAATGAVMGTIVPGIGNIAGAFTGGVIGAMGGEEVGRWAAEHLDPRSRKPDPGETEPPKPKA